VQLLGDLDWPINLWSVGHHYVRFPRLLSPDLFLSSYLATTRLHARLQGLISQTQLHRHHRALQILHTVVSYSSSSAEESEADFSEKLNRAWSTPTKWYPIPIALGALVLLAVKLRKDSRSDEATVDSQREGAVVRSSRLDGPWQVRQSVSDSTCSIVLLITRSA
jgi:hypothetical protein